MFELTLSVKAIAVFCAQMIAWVGVCGLLGFFIYFPSENAPYGKLRHFIYAAGVVISFALIFGIVTINWVQ